MAAEAATPAVEVPGVVADLAEAGEALAVSAAVDSVAAERAGAGENF